MDRYPDNRPFGAAAAIVVAVIYGFLIGFGVGYLLWGRS